MKMKSSLYVKYLLTTLLIMLASSILAFLATNMYYHQVLKKQNDAKNTGIASRMAAYIDQHPALDLQEHFAMLGEIGYQFYVVSESGDSNFYGGEYRLKELDRSIIEDVLAGNVYHGMRDYPNQLFVTGFFANDLRNSIGVPFVHEKQRYAMFVRPDIRLLFSEVHSILGGMVVLMLLISLLSILISAWYLVRPIKALTAATRRIAAEDFEIRLEVSRSDELGELAVSFNRMAKELLAHEEERRRFIRNVSHDFQSPLLNIGGYAALLLKPDLDENDRMQYASVIESEAARLSKLTKQLLVLTSLEQRIKPLSERCFPLHEQIERIVLKYRWLLEKEDISLSLDLSPIFVTGDEAMLENVWENLLTNAIKYNKPGGEIRIRIEEDQDLAHVVVEDTGIGIAEKELPRVLERFYRADASRTTKGTGLGLAIVKETLALHQGEIRIASKPGAGTCITVTLPVKMINPGLDPV